MGALPLYGCALGVRPPSLIPTRPAPLHPTPPRPAPLTHAPPSARSDEEEIPAEYRQDVPVAHGSTWVNSHIATRLATAGDEKHLPM
jgi:hypothetical protein